MLVGQGKSIRSGITVSVNSKESQMTDVITKEEIYGNITAIVATTGGDVTLEVLKDRLADLSMQDDDALSIAALLVAGDMIALKHGIEPTFFRYKNGKVYPLAHAMRSLRACTDAAFTDTDREICERARKNEYMCVQSDFKYLDDDCILLKIGAIMKGVKEDGSTAYILTWLGSKLIGELDNVDKI